MLTLIAILLLLAIFGCAIAVLDHWVWADRSVEWRFAEGYPEHLPALAADLVRAKVELRRLWHGSCLPIPSGRLLSGKAESGPSTIPALISFGGWD